MTDTTPAPEGVTPEQVAAMCKRLQMMPTYSSDPKGLHWTPDKAAAMLEALAADRDAQTARADAMQRGYDELYADALADARSDAQEFESDLWKLLRDYLTELNLDWSDYTEDGITAEQVIEHIRECMDGETARADAAEAETSKVRRFLKISRDEGGEALARAEAAEAKVARLVEALGKAANRLDWASGLIATETGRDQAGVWAEETRAAIAEVQG